MGKNSRVSHNLCRGKFKKKTVPSRWPKKAEESCNEVHVTSMDPLAGSRIINLDQLATFVSTVSAHSRSCQQGIVTLQGERYREGLASVLSAKCSGCRMEVAFPTSSKVTGLRGDQRWECNLAAVWGQMSTGGGHAPLTESMSVLGVPVMTKKSFIATEKAIGSWWKESLEESMMEAAEEEKRRAIERGSHHEGVPAISVILDGGWSKRTHKHSYNAKSGVAVIIGVETGKLLHVGVRNKYCSVCAQATKSKTEPRQHDCYKNWDGASSSMETDILVQGFKEAETKYGLRYTTFTGDGDSSVHASLVTEVPGWGHAIRKVECANHAIKCYRGALEKLVTEKPNYKGRGKITQRMRKRLTTVARCAIKMRSMGTDKKQALEFLRQDLRNGPLHCFGIHTHCSTDYCKVAQNAHTSTTSTSTDAQDDSTSANVEEEEEEAVARIASQEGQFWEDAMNEDELETIRSVAPKPPDNIDDKMMYDIQNLVGRLIAKAGQLLGNFTTNLAESWMHIGSKFDGGKQINRSQSGSWEARCSGAGLRANEGPELGAKTWKKITGEEANPVFTVASEKKAKEVAADRKRKATDEAKSSRRASKYAKTTDNSLQARSDYARHDDGPGVREVYSDVPQAYFQGQMIDYYRVHVTVSEVKAAEIERITRGQSSTDDVTANMWLTERRIRITSSITGTIAKRRSTTKVRNLVKTLLYKGFRGNTATQYGHDREAVSRIAYLREKHITSSNTLTTASGLVIHPKHHWLAASPDDLDDLVHDPSSDDPLGIVEYKNPYKCKDMLLVDAATQVKDFCLVNKDGCLSLKHTHNYYYQVQATMFCTQRKWCDFVVHTETDLHVERLYWDAEFWSAAMPRLREFYFTAILPELVLPHQPKGGIREPSAWLKDAAAWRNETDGL